MSTSTPLTIPTLRRPTLRFGVNADPITLIVRVAWFAMFAHVLWYVGRFGVRAPYQDEWLFTGVLTSDTLNWNWVWSLHAEHRYPLGRIFYWLITTWTADFRTGAVVTACLNGATAFGLMLLSRRLRGRASLVDLLFPALLLNWGQFENYLFGYQVVFSMTVAGMAVVLAAAALYTLETAFRCGLGAALALLVIVQGGGYGLAAVGPVSFWIAGIAFGLWRRGMRGKAIGLLVSPLASAIYSGVVLANYQSCVDATPAATLAGKGLVFLQALGCGLGDGVATRGFPVPWAGFGLLAGYALATIGLLAVILRKPEERWRAMGIAVVIAWAAAASLAIAMVRGAGYAPRYAGPGAIGVCGLLIAAILYGPRLHASLRSVIVALAVIGAIGLVLVNVPTARYVAKERREAFKEMQANMAAGMPPRYVASKFGDIFFFSSESLADLIKPLAGSRFHSFDALRPDPPIRDVLLDSVGDSRLPAAGPGAFADRSKLPSLVLWSGPPREVHGVRVKFTLTERLQLLTLVVKDETGRVAAVYRKPKAGEHEALFWIGCTVSELRLEPASLSPEIVISSAVLEIPPE